MMALVPHLSSNSLLKVTHICCIHSAKAVWTPTRLHDSVDSVCQTHGEQWLNEILQIKSKDEFVAREEATGIEDIGTGAPVRSE
jgi:hypothetical protein